jgi:hypothetical protein
MVQVRRPAVVFVWRLYRQASIAHILELARKGAEHRYLELKAEIAALRKYFPELSGGASRHRRFRIDVSSEPAAMIDRPRRKRRRMSAAARKAVSQRMKKYWAARRAGRKK